MVTIFFTHVHVLQKAYKFFTTVIIFCISCSMECKFTVKNAYAFKDDDCICRMCEAWFRKSLEMSHDTEATSSKRKLRKYESAIDTSCAFETKSHLLVYSLCNRLVVWLHASRRAFKNFQIYQYFTIYRQYFFLKI
jgi:hypothetical protein